MIFPYNVGKFMGNVVLIHWGRVTHICVGKLTVIGSDNGLDPGRRLAIIWTNAGILFIEPLGTNKSDILNQNWNIFIEENALENVVCEMASILCWPQCVDVTCILFGDGLRWSFSRWNWWLCYQQKAALTGLYTGYLEVTTYITGI